MMIQPTSFSSSESDMRSDTNWDELYCLLIPIVTGWVFSSRIPSWSLQRDDMVAEIVQEAITRTFVRLRKGWGGESPPVKSLERISITIAHNYYIDVMRR